MKIENFAPDEQDEIKAFVLGIQNGEFNLSFEADEQPDLLNIQKFYGSGGFWVAKVDNSIVGTIGLQKLDEESGALRKMFVRKEYRSSDLKIAQKLFHRLLNTAQKKGFRYILLDTPAIAGAAHRFYEKNGFIRLSKSQVPTHYNYPDRDSRIYKLVLRGDHPEYT